MVREPQKMCEWGGRADSNRQPPEPHSGALPLRHDHHVISC